MCPHTTHVLILLYMPHTATDICVLILLHMCPHPTTYVSSYYYIRVLTLPYMSAYYYIILPHMRPHATTHPSYPSSCYYIYVLMLLYMRPHTTTYVSSYYYTCVLILLHMCPHTSVPQDGRLSAASTSVERGRECRGGGGGHALGGAGWWGARGGGRKPDLASHLSELSRGVCKKKIEKKEQKIEEKRAQNPVTWRPTSATSRGVCIKKNRQKKVRLQKMMYTRRKSKRLANCD
jgi:hypothetical protein